MIADQNEDTSTPNGRERTDQSLSAERAKTDQSLLEAKKRLERHADESVSTSREEADETRTQIRVEGDNSRKIDRTVSGASQVDEQLLEERQRIDSALDRERCQMDQVLERERSQKQRVENELLQEERTETDQDLNSERKWTDNEYLRAANIHSDEMKGHLATRAALTSRQELLAIVSHDLKNPLASISMAVDLMKSAEHDGTADEIRNEYMDLIGRNAHEALRLISDILDMERMAAGKVTLQVERHDFNDIIQYSFRTFEHQATDKKLSLHRNCSNTNALVICDQDRISQVLANLISNALKFTPKGGHVSLSVECRAEEVQVSVSDTGPGIPEDMQEKIFERFWQIAEQNRSGLGIGLYISKMIVEAHRGRIWVDSRLGQGSTFSFTLPLGRRSNG
ncbi:MAG TPA: ATP-binding protein [Oligoflexus sp.]|uniref:sensor histidine kinase n=1 Tax=Oligoflexus sp. TaxID=1971216 RepID=UPI002D7F6856|nr:ATP-binding protein [Oligoflexus sp.]HET9241545.1 ATP-binding protein [Oligoflexus sp.]